jgi:alpha-ketoglutarate-dependent taurine dioxygenase
MFLIIIFTSFLIANCFNVNPHPLEKRIGYITGIKNIESLEQSTIDDLLLSFKKYPLLVFKGLENINPNTFLDFVKKFDEFCDEDALKNPELHQHQMLQPFDQFPDCKHVAPRGNIELLNYHDIKNIKISPYEHFINNYVWHTDILGHEYKLPNIVTGFYIIEQPLIGADTDFISGETIFENLSIEEQNACKNILIEINRRKFITHSLEIDYAGVNRLEKYELREDGNTQIPLVYAPNNDNIYEKPRILIMPTFFERVVGWSISDSRKWIKKFMNEKVLPHRISVQWKKGDLAVFNNRRFIHSSTPARNYLDNIDSSKRLLLQTFIPTNKPLLSYQPLKKDVYSCYNVGWINDQEISIISAHNKIKFSEKIALKNNEIIDKNGIYVFQKKIEKND